MRKKYMKALSGLLMVVALAATGCKKTVNVAPEGLPGNRIVEYKVTNVTGDPIKGVIDHNEKTIRVYLPYYLGLTAIEPQIKVSDGAQVTSTNDAVITDVIGIVKNKKQVSYTVRGKDNKEATYKLIIEVQQPDFEMLELSPSAEAPKVYRLMFAGLSIFQIYWADRKPPIFNTAVTKIVLVNQNGGEFVVADANIIFSTNRINVSTPPNFTELNTGIYKVRVDSYSKSYELKYPIQITLP